MSQDTYKARRDNLSSIGFGSTASWAADLYSDFSTGGSGASYNENIDAGSFDCQLPSNPSSYSDLADFNAKTAKRSDSCKQAAFLPYLSCLLNGSYREFSDQNKDFDSKVSNSIDWFHRITEAQMDYVMFGTTDGTKGIAMKCKPQHPQVLG